MNKPTVVSLSLAFSLILGLAAVGLARDPSVVLTPVKKANAEELVGDTHRLYVEPNGKGWIILFKSAEVAANNDLGNFNGVWLSDEKTATVKVFRFDTQEGVALSLFSAPSVKGYVIGYRTASAGPWHFLFPEKSVPEVPAITVAALR